MGHARRFPRARFPRVRLHGRGRSHRLDGHAAVRIPPGRRTARERTNSFLGAAKAMDPMHQNAAFSDFDCFDSRKTAPRRFAFHAALAACSPLAEAVTARADSCDPAALGAKCTAPRMPRRWRRMTRPSSRRSASIISQGGGELLITGSLALSKPITWPTVVYAKTPIFRRTLPSAARRTPSSSPRSAAC